MGPLRQWIAAAIGHTGSKKKSGKVRDACTLSLVEAVNNAIFHAHGRVKDIPIRVFISVGDKSISIEVADRGKGLGRHMFTKPEEMISHGRGLFLIHRLMSRVESRLKDGLHILRMTYEL